MKQEGALIWLRADTIIREQSHDRVSLDATSYATASIGLLLQKDGSIFDVVPGTPAYDAGLGPSMKVVAVDGHTYSPEVLTESIAHPPNGKISLTVSNFDTVQTREIRYAGGVRNPHLEPIPGRHDYLSEILAPRAPAKQ